MCTRGVFQLRKLSLFFCDFGGSSAGVRELLISHKLEDFMQKNPQIEYQLICKRNHHPYLCGAYLNGFIKEVCVRSQSADEIIGRVLSLRNQIGRQLLPASGPRVYSPVHSVQGKWQPNMFNTRPQAELERTHHIPRPIKVEIEKERRNLRFRKTEDFTNKMLRSEANKGRIQD